MPVTIVTACTANNVLVQVDEKLAKVSKMYLYKKKYDIAFNVDVDSMLLLISLRKMLVSKLTGALCYTMNKQEIISKILNLIN